MNAHIKTSACDQSAQPCGCDPGCKPTPHFCEVHRFHAMRRDVLRVSRVIEDYTDNALIASQTELVALLRDIADRYA